MSDARPWVLLLELVNAYQLPGRVSALLPLVQGYVDEVGAASR